MTPRLCDNTDCDKLVPTMRSNRIRFGKSLFCSRRCKKVYFLWVEAIARQRPQIAVRPLGWEKRI
jgi:hypothetical protein